MKNFHTMSKTRVKFCVSSKNTQDIHMNGFEREYTVVVTLMLYKTTVALLTIIPIATCSPD